MFGLLAVGFTVPVPPLVVGKPLPKLSDDFTDFSVVRFDLSGNLLLSVHLRTEEYEGVSRARDAGVGVGGGLSRRS